MQMATCWLRWGLRCPSTHSRKSASASWHAWDRTRRGASSVACEGCRSLTERLRRTLRARPTLEVSAQARHRSHRPRYEPVTVVAVRLRRSALPVPGRQNPANLSSLMTTATALRASLTGTPSADQVGQLDESLGN